MVRSFTKNRIVWTFFESQHVKGSQTVVESSWESFYHIFSSLWGELIQKKFPWLKFEIIGVFVNTHGLPITSTLFRSVRTYRSLLNCNYLKNKKNFLGLFLHWWNVHQIFNIFKNKKIVIANVFPKLMTLQELVRPLSKKRRVRTSFDGQHVKGPKTLVKSSWVGFYHIFRSLRGEMIWKISPW